MRILSKSLKVLLLSSCLMTASKASTITLSLNEFTALADKFSTTETNKAVEVNKVVGSALDKGAMGTVAASGESYVSLDSSNKLNVLALVAGTWCSFQSAAALADITVTGQVDLAQTFSDGTAATTNKLTINLTKGTGAAITPAALVTFLKANLITANKSFTTGALKTLSVTPPAGWTATALFQLSTGSNTATDAIAATLDPLAFTLTVPVTPAAGGLAVNYAYALTDISSFNVVPTTGSVTGGADVVALVNSTAAGNTLTLKLKPQLLTTRTVGIMAGLVTAANTLTQKMLKGASPYTYPTLTAMTSSLSTFITSFGGNASDSLTAVTNSIAKTSVLSDNFTTADLTGANIIETTKYGLVAMTATDISAMSGWSTAGTANGTLIKVNGTVSGVIKEFSCLISTGTNTFKNAAETAAIKKVLQFTAEDGDVFWVKAFDTTGLDASGFSTSALQDDYLALLIADKLNGVTAISKKTLAELKTAAA